MLKIKSWSEEISLGLSGVDTLENLTHTQLSVVHALPLGVVAKRSVQYFCDYFLPEGEILHGFLRGLFSIFPSCAWGFHEHSTIATV